MKRKHLLAIIMLLLPFMGWAQKPSMPVDIDAGLKLGANFAKLNGDTWDDGYKASFLGGLFAGVKGKRFGVQVEGLFSQSNYTTTGKEFYNVYKPFFNSLADSAKEGSFRVNYLNIPVLFQVKVIGNVWVQAGPQYSGIVSVNDKDDLVKDAKALFKNGSISGVLGVQLGLPANLNVGARYILGFSDVNGSNVPLSDTWQQRTIQLHIGYNFL